jgi:hypothetical protein
LSQSLEPNIFLINLQVKNTTPKAICHQHFSIESSNPFPQEKIYLFVFALLLIVYGSPVFAQKSDENSLSLLKGQILNMEDETPVSKAIVSNQRTKETVTANMKGYFTINALNTDSLEVSALGFSKQTISIPSNYNNSNILIIYASIFRFLLPDVNVNGSYQKPILKVEKIEVSPYFRKEFMREKPAEEKAYQNQISFLKVPLYGKEQPSRKSRNVLKADKKWATVSKIYNVELVRELTGLNATEADIFMMFLNSKQLFNKMTTKENASFIILEQFTIYRKAGH